MHVNVFFIYEDVVLHRWPHEFTLTFLSRDASRLIFYPITSMGWDPGALVPGNGGMRTLLTHPLALATLQRQLPQHSDANTAMPSRDGRKQPGIASQAALPLPLL